MKYAIYAHHGSVYIRMCVAPRAPTNQPPGRARCAGRSRRRGEGRGGAQRAAQVLVRCEGQGVCGWVWVGVGGKVCGRNGGHSWRAWRADGAGAPADGMAAPAARAVVGGVAARAAGELATRGAGGTGAMYAVGLGAAGLVPFAALAPYPDDLKEVRVRVRGLRASGSGAPSPSSNCPPATAPLPL